MEWTTVLQNAAIAAVVAAAVTGLMGLLGQKLERSARRKELLLAKAAELAIARNENVMRMAEGENGRSEALVADVAALTSIYFLQLKDLFDHSTPIEGGAKGISTLVRRNATR